jgi:hypothetical protein
MGGGGVILRSSWDRTSRRLTVGCLKREGSCDQKGVNSSVNSQRSRKMSQAKDLGNLIVGLNPYTNREIPDTTLEAGDMNIYCSSPVSGTTRDVSQIEVELDGPYRQEWTFKGEPQKIGMAYRIKYRFPVYRKPAQGQTRGNPLYWLEDYILIGFEGGMGG